MSQRRAAALAQALRILAPALPEKDRAAVVDRALGSRQMGAAPAPVAAWAALVAYARHGFTDYDALLAEGYGPEAARHFVEAAVAARLAAWGCRRPVAGEDR
ncbi:DUF2293 domain-containing protein [Zavarzinia sp.]|uniref:DUF2293 domain-containing protein n=1 Tax=Zavarzinia sp. TaxID=2027920 RepID=UPI0035683D45